MTDKWKKTAPTFKCSQCRELINWDYKTWRKMGPKRAVCPYCGKNPY